MDKETRADGSEKTTRDRDESPKRTGQDGQNYLASGYHCISPGKAIYTINPQGDLAMTPNFLAAPGSPSSMSPASATVGCPSGQNVYMSMDDYYKLHG